MIEVTHGDGLAGSSIQYGFSKEPEMDLISEAAEVCEQARIAALLLPGIATVEELKEAVERGVKVLRIVPPTAPRPTSPRNTSRWPGRWTWRR